MMFRAAFKFQQLSDKFCHVCECGRTCFCWFPVGDLFADLMLEKFCPDF